MRKKINSKEETEGRTEFKMETECNSRAVKIISY